jgi:RNA polymerase sigma-70 factor (ECF subfamily)
MSSRTPSTVLDEFLVAQSQCGDSEAFASLVGRWHPRLLRNALRYTGDAEAAKDVAQEVWLAIARGLHSLNDPACFRAWAYRIVANKSRDWIRRERSRRRLNQSLDRPSPGVEQGSEAVERIRIAIGELDTDQRTILTWFYMEEMSVREIAEALSIPPGTVKSRLYHARHALRACLEEDQ